MQASRVLRLDCRPALSALIRHPEMKQHELLTAVKRPKQWRPDRRQFPRTEMLFANRPATTRGRHLFPTPAWLFHQEKERPKCRPDSLTSKRSTYRRVTMMVESSRIRQRS